MSRNVDCSDLVFNLRRPEVNSEILAAVNGASEPDFGFVVVVVVVVVLGPSVGFVVVVVVVVVLGPWVGLGLLAWRSPAGTTGGIVSNLCFESVFTNDSKSWLIDSVVLHKPG